MPKEADIFAGKKIREIRKNLGISQEQLANEIGITFQQIQKYEKAMNRISVSMLVDIAAALKVPVIVFFDTAGLKDMERLLVKNYMSALEGKLKKFIKGAQDENINA